MNIKKVKDYSTEIKGLLSLSNPESVFISSWDKDEHILNINNDLLFKIANDYSNVNRYIMSKDMIDVKNEIHNNFITNGVNLNINNFTILSNGTSAAFMSFLQLMKKGIKKTLVIGPIYFIYKKLSEILNIELYYWNIDPFQYRININFESLINELKQNKIKAILLTLPFFGTGVSLGEKSIYKLIEICEDNKIHIVIDYIYENMTWKSNERIHNYKLIERILSFDYCIIYESISKRVFLNGVKNAIIYSNTKTIEGINSDSEVCLGSISYVQEAFLKYMYDSVNLPIIYRSIEESITHCENNYKLLRTLIMDTDALLTYTDRGYFCLMAIPINYFSKREDYDIAIEIIQKCNVITIPHSRYFYSKKDYYCFRINLTLQTDVIIEAIQKILHINF